MHAAIAHGACAIDMDSQAQDRHGIQQDMAYLETWHTTCQETLTETDNKSLTQTHQMTIEQGPYYTQSSGAKPR